MITFLIEDIHYQQVRKNLKTSIKNIKELEVRDRFKELREFKIITCGEDLFLSTNKSIISFKEIPKSNHFGTALRRILQK